MNIIITDSYEEMSQITAQIVLSKMYTEKRVNLSLTGGATPKRMYEIMIPFVKGKEYLNNVHYYNFDEIAIKGKRYGLTMNTLKEQFYDDAELKDENIHELNTENYEGYDQMLLEAGGLDLILCGIGADGHFCGNIPGTTKFGYKTFCVDIKEGTDMYNDLKNLMSDVPGGKAVTFGPKTVLGAKQVLLFANGKAKASIVKKALEGDITEDVPSSILRLHPNLTIILDKEAASKLTNQ